MNVKPLCKPFERGMPKKISYPTNGFTYKNKSHSFSHSNIARYFNDIKPIKKNYTFKYKHLDFL